MREINGIILKDKVYKLSEGGCFKCAFGYNLLKSNSSCLVNEICDIFPYSNEEKDHCFRFSPELTDKLKGK